MKSSAASLETFKRSFPAVGWVRLALLAVACCLMLSVANARGEDDATAPQERNDPAAVENPAAEEPPSAEQIRGAEIKVAQAEVDLLAAKIELARVKPQAGLDADQLKQQMEEAQASLTKAQEFIRSFLVLGPITVDENVINHDEASCKAVLDRAFVPAEAMPRAGETATIDGQSFEWKVATGEDYFIDLREFAEATGKDGEHAAYAGQVYVTSSKELDGVRLSIGSDDDSVWRVNGKEVCRVYEGRPVDRDQNQSEPFTLKSGANSMSFTVINGDGDCAAAARLIDKDGNPILGLTVSTTPPVETAPSAAEATPEPANSKAAGPETDQ